MPKKEIPFYVVRKKAPTDACIESPASPQPESPFTPATATDLLHAIQRRDDEQRQKREQRRERERQKRAEEDKEKQQRLAETPHEQIPCRGSGWIKVALRSPGIYDILDIGFSTEDQEAPEEIEEEYIPSISLQEGLGEWDDEVENLDDESDASCFQLSMHLRWKDVEIDLMRSIIHAPSVERIREALQHIKTVEWDSDNV